MRVLSRVECELMQQPVKHYLKDGPLVAQLAVDGVPASDVPCFALKGKPLRRFGQVGCKHSGTQPGLAMVFGETPSLFVKVTHVFIKAVNGSYGDSEGPKR